MNSSPSHKGGSSWSSSDGSLSWSSRLPVSAGLKICLKLAVALSLKFHWLHLGKVPQTAWQKECSSGGVVQHNLSTVMNSPTTNISHLDCVWQLQLSVSLEASHLTLNLMIWIFNLLECEWHFSISDSLILQGWDPLRVRLNWVEVSENIPSKALFILVLDIQDCLLLCNLTREFDVRQSTQCFVPVEMYFEWSYSLKPPVTPFLVITLKLFQNRVHRRLPLRQSFEVSGHLRSGHLWAGSGHLWAGLIRLHCLSSSFKRVSSWPSSYSCLSWSQDFRPHLFRELIGAVPRLPSIRSCLANLSDAWAANRGCGLYFSTKPFHLFLASDSVREGFCRLRIS